jgi:hypothetical protein
MNRWGPSLIKRHPAMIRDEVHVSVGVSVAKLTKVGRPTTYRAQTQPTMSLFSDSSPTSAASISHNRGEDPTAERLRQL